MNYKDYPILRLSIVIGMIGGLILSLIGCNSSIVTGDNQVVSNAAVVQPTKEKPTATKVPATPTPTPSPTSTPTLTPTPTPTLGPLLMPDPPDPLYAYHTLSTGETLTYLAQRYQTTVEELVAMNNLDSTEAIVQIDQTLRVPVNIETESPDTVLWPDSEVVYSPSYVDFDVAEFIEEQGGYLAHYTERVDGEMRTGTEIIIRIAEQFSVGPRIQLALLEYYGGWVTNPHPGEYELNRPLGPRNPRGGSLYLAMAWTANRINAGYYGYKRDGFWIFQLSDYSTAVTPSGLNAGTVGIQNILALHSDEESWEPALSEEGLMATYRTFFGDPEQYALEEPLVTNRVTQPPLSLPWEVDEGFYLTSGPHPGYIDGSGWAAVDFGPPDVLGNCFYSALPNTAAADGVIVAANPGEVQLDLDGDGKFQTGWVLLYLHVTLDDENPVEVGQQVSEGDVLGYASCEGGLADSSHLHFARRYNGEWIDAGGAIPLNLSGWEFQSTQVAYEGLMIKGEETREACECWEPELNLLIHEEGTKELE